MSNNREKLFTEFEAPTTQEWLDKIQVDLKGADFNKRLVWRTNEGFSVPPFYRREDVEKLKTPDALPGEFPFVRGNKKDSNSWYVRQDIKVDDAKEGNAKALDVLSKGVDSLGFHFCGDCISAEFVETLLDGVKCDCVELNFCTCKRRSVDLAKILCAYFESKGYAKESIVGSIDWDPIEKIVMKGKDVTRLLPLASQLVDMFKDYPHFRCIAVNAASLNNAGAYIVQELGYALAWGHEYLSELVEAGVDPALAASKIKFNMGITENYFMEIAKFRAARLLWAEIVKQYEPKCDCACKMCVNATTTTYNMTMYDSYVNLLRTQTEAMSAALGGVHSISVVPFDAVYETPTDFSERIARNQQLLLKEESHFDKVVDPSAGSYFIEELTTSLADAAWKLFLKIEEQGGYLEAVKCGVVQDDVNTTNTKRHEDAAKRKEFILGTNQYPNFNEFAAEKIERTEGCSKEGSCGCAKGGDASKALATARMASDFEALRLATEAAANRPKVFMLTIGNLAMRLARAQFSSNFFGCAGYEIIDNIGFDTVEQGITAAIEKKADVVVLCSSDDEYATYAPEAYKLLDGKAEFVVAGAPACTDDLKALGIENFIHVRSNVLETLQQFNSRLLR